MKNLLAMALSSLLLTSASALAATSDLCVTNGSGEDLFFVAEATGGERQAKWLAAQETLCSGAEQATGGVVSVFVSEDHLEGCSRLVSAANSETLLEYVDFDRCRWSSHEN